MNDALFKELQKGLEDIINKFNTGLNPLEKLGGKKYSLYKDTEHAVIFKTTSLSKRKMIMGIELHGNIIEATPNSSDQRLDKVRDYLQTFSDKYEGKGIVLRYIEFNMPLSIPQLMYPYDMS